MISAIAAPPSILGLLAALFMLYIFSTLSRKLGNVTKMKPHYRGLYIGMALVGLAIVAHLLRVVAWLEKSAPPDIFTSDTFYLFTYYLPMAVAVTISLSVVLRYWGWLFTERNR
jgi:hypothetical protein